MAHNPNGQLDYLLDEPFNVLQFVGLLERKCTNGCFGAKESEKEEVGWVVEAAIDKILDVPHLDFTLRNAQMIEIARSGDVAHQLRLLQCCLRERVVRGVFGCGCSVAGMASLIRQEGGDDVAKLKAISFYSLSQQKIDARSLATSIYVEYVDAVRGKRDQRPRA